MQNNYINLNKYSQCIQPHTSGAIVFSYPQLVQVSRISNGEFVIICVDRLLSVLHVNSQLITALSSNPLDVVQACGEKKQHKLYCIVDTRCMYVDPRQTNQIVIVTPAVLKISFYFQSNWLSTI